VRPLGGGGSRRQGAASVRARCRADGGPEHRLAAQRSAGAVQRWRCLSRCTDQSAGGGADWHTVSATRARACDGLDAAEALPRRRAAWRSRGRWWRGPAARATERPYHISAVQAGPLTATRPGIPGKPRVREPRPPATVLRQQLAAPARVALRRSLGRPRWLGRSTRQCVRQGIVHTCWGKRRARAAELVPSVGL
jgi:hypothetical protein